MEEALNWVKYTGDVTILSKLGAVDNYWPMLSIFFTECKYKCSKLLLSFIKVLFWKVECMAMWFRVYLRIFKNFFLLCIREKTEWENFNPVVNFILYFLYWWFVWLYIFLNILPNGCHEFIDIISKERVHPGIHVFSFIREISSWAKTIIFIFLMTLLLLCIMKLPYICFTLWNIFL